MGKKNRKQLQATKQKKLAQSEAFHRMNFLYQ
jgi:hypothetical protein